MKSPTSTLLILVLAFTTVIGIVIAQVSPGSQSTSQVSEEREEMMIENSSHPVLGEVLFEHVTTVHFSGVDMPRNSDGSFGGWVTQTDPGVLSQMTIYENFIVQESRLPDGTTYRDIRPYDQLARIEQQTPKKAN